jgi:hypothetical protein
MQRRLTEQEQKNLRDAWEILSQIRHLWQEIDSVRLAIRLMFEQSTTDGLPYVEPPLTDKDARQRPWVMVKDDSAHPWHGPRMLAACCPENYFTFTPSKWTIVGFRYCRRATSEEIAAARLEVAE